MRAGQHGDGADTGRGDLGDSENQGGHGQGDQDRTDGVQLPTDTRQSRLPQDMGGQQQGGQPHRNVHQEHRAPAEELHQHAAEHLAGDEADGRRRTVQAQCSGPARAFGETRGDE